MFFCIHGNRKAEFFILVEVFQNIPFFVTEKSFLPVDERESNVEKICKNTQFQRALVEIKIKLKGDVRMSSSQYVSADVAF